MRVYCNHCGNQAPEGSRFCPYCGTDLTPAAPPSRPVCDLSRAVGDYYDLKQGGSAPAPPPASAPKGDPWAVGGLAYGSGNPNPWGTTAAAKPRKKGLVGKVVLILLAVLVLAVAGLYALGSSHPDYQPLIDSYLRYAQEERAGSLEALYHPTVFDSYLERTSRSQAYCYADAWTEKYGIAVEEYRLGTVIDDDTLLAEFNDRYAAHAGDLVDAAVDVYYADGSKGCINFVLVEEDGLWFLVYTY